jgi:Family of unknown function (DUF5908)
MPVTIREITSEVVLAPESGEQPAESADLRPEAREELLESLVRQATERVLERLRLEWER